MPLDALFDKFEQEFIMDNLKTQANGAEIKFFCPYLKRNISEGLCYDMQMICNLYIKPSVLPEITIDKDELKSFCNGCKYEL